ncbi:hypothetical protein BGX29_006521, partial [Mortierella sp. GBA35]
MSGNHDRETDHSFLIDALVKRILSRHLDTTKLLLPKVLSVDYDLKADTKTPVSPPDYVSHVCHVNLGDWKRCLNISSSDGYARSMCTFFSLLSDLFLTNFNSPSSVTSFQYLSDRSSRLGNISIKNPSSRLSSIDQQPCIANARIEGATIRLRDGSTVPTPDPSVVSDPAVTNIPAFQVEMADVREIFEGRRPGGGRVPGGGGGGGTKAYGHGERSRQA